MKAASALLSARPTRPIGPEIIILGGGPNRIGQGIEFDYCCVHAAYALKEAGFETIMVNCNPETVSTDYDTSDRLYFEPLTDEDVIALMRREQQNGTVLGCIVQYRRADPAEAVAGARPRRHPHPGHSAPTRSTSPRIASASSSCCTALGCASRRTASPAPPKKPRPSPNASAIPW